MLKIKTPKTHRGKRELEKRAPKLVEDEKKTLILHGTKTSNVLNSVLTEIHHLKKGNSIKYSRKNDNIRPFEAGGETNLEFFSQKTDCALFVDLQSRTLIGAGERRDGHYYFRELFSVHALVIGGVSSTELWHQRLGHPSNRFGSHSKKRPDNLVIGRFYDHHVYDLVELGVENFRSLQSFSYDKKIAPKMGSKPLIAFIGEGFESVDELKHLKEVLLDLLRGEVVENLNLAGVDRIYVCTAVSPNRVFLSHCALRLKKSGTTVPRMELVEAGPSMDLVVRRHRLPNEGLRKEAMRTAPEHTKKKVKNVKGDPILGKTGKIYIPDQKIGEMALPYKAKGLKRERREAKKNKSSNTPLSKKQKGDDST